MSNQFKRSPRQLVTGAKLETRQKINDLLIEMRSMWRHRNFGRIWYLTVHCIGAAGYAAFSLIAAISLFVIFLTLSLMDSSVMGSEQLKSAKGTSLPFNPLRVLALMVKGVVMLVFRMFAGFMGWGAKHTKPMHIPGHIIGSIAEHMLPNRTTQFFGYLTLVAIAAYAIQSLFLVYGGV